jgi:PKHD-type hydroxylase
MFYLFPKVVSKEKCERLLEYCIKNTNFTEATVLNKGESDVDLNNQGRNDPSIRKTDIAFVSPDGQEDNKVNEIAWHFLAEANKIQFNYDLKYFQPVQFARYRDGGYYDWHQDSTGIRPDGETRKLSLTFSLSDPKDYEGGELEFYNAEKPMRDISLSDGTKILGSQVKKNIRDQGSIIVFDSRDYHRVTPCTRGTRYSIVCWSVGPNFI